MAETYDPNCEATNTEKVLAGHWELLRRNEEFQELSRRWLQSEVFRQSHALSPDYHDMQHHTPRCAWDWMLTAPQRVRLARFQIEKLSWLTENDFNFGPIICRENFSASNVTSKNWHEFLKVEPLPNPPPPITVAQPWDSTPELFRKQFRLAYASTNEFGEINERLDELANLLRFRDFVVHCLRCGSFKLRVIGERDGDSGEVKAYLFCPCCRVRERMPMR